MCRHAIRLVALLLSGAGSLAAQEPRYTPTHRNPGGREIVAVFLSYSRCPGNNYAGLTESVDSMNRSLARQASDRHLPFVAVGVSSDWEPDSGYAYLKRLSSFDEVIVGRNWFNLGFQHWVWADSAGQAAVPQVIVLERTINPARSRVSFGQERVLARFPGPRQIVDWVKRGALLP